MPPSLRLMDFLFILFLFTACTAPVKEKGSHSWRNGQILFVELEGGFFIIQTDNGERLLPLNLEAAYQQNALRIRFRYQTAEKTTTTTMQGIPVILTDIQKQ